MEDEQNDSAQTDFADGERTMHWIGMTLPETLSDWAREARDSLANAARDGRWEEVLAVLRENEEFVNCSRLGGKSLFTPLHQAAHADAPHEVVDRLIELGAWRTMKNAKGERAVDIARRKGGRPTLISQLEPVLRSAIPLAALKGLQENFHAVILERATTQVRENQLRLPDLEPMTEYALGQRFWFAVPGMYGGFNYWLERAGAEPRLLTESWCRVVEGSEQGHAVTSHRHERLVRGLV